MLLHFWDILLWDILKAGKASKWQRIVSHLTIWQEYHQIENTDVGDENSLFSYHLIFLNLQKLKTKNLLYQAQTQIVMSTEELIG